MRILVMCALLAAPLCALDVDALYEKWSERERTHLLGRDVLDDETLIDQLEPRAGRPNDDGPPADWKAATLLGIGYLYGKAGAPRDRPTAEHYLTRAAKADNRARYALSLCAISEDLPHYNPYTDKTLVADFVRMGRVPQTLIELAEEKHVAAAAIVGLLSRIIGKTDEEQERYITISAKGGSMPAMLWLWLLTGEQSWLETAAKAEYGPAAYVLGIEALNRRVRADGRTWLFVAAKQGIEAAQRALNALDKQERSEKKNLKIADSWREYNAESPSLRAESWDGKEFWISDPPNAVRWMYSNYDPDGDWSRAWHWEGLALLGNVADADTSPSRVLIAERTMYEEHVRDSSYHPEKRDPEALLIEVTDSMPDARCRLADLRFMRAARARDRTMERWARETMWQAWREGSKMAKRRYYAAVLDGREWIYFTDPVTPDRYRAPGKEEALKGMQELASANDAWAAHQLAQYSLGQGSFNDAVAWFKKAAGLGDAQSMLRLAEMYAFGSHVRRDLSQADHYARMALDDPHYFVAASELREHIYNESSDSPKQTTLRKEKEAAESLEKIGDLDDYLRANPHLMRSAMEWSPPLTALCYLKGHGVLRNRALALQMAWDAGASAVAMYVVAEYYATATPPDHDKALLFFGAAANAGFAFGKYYRARYLLEGKTVRKDESAAAALFKEAADQGCLPAMVEYAQCLRDGTGVQADKDAAKQWLQKAAKENWQPAKELLDDWK